MSEIYLDYRRHSAPCPSWVVRDGNWQARTPTRWDHDVAVMLTDGKGNHRGNVHFASVDDFLRLAAQLHRIAVDMHRTVTKYGGARWVVEHLDLQERRQYPIGELLPQLERRIQLLRKRGV